MAFCPRLALPSFMSLFTGKKRPENHSRRLPELAAPQRRFIAKTPLVIGVIHLAIGMFVVLPGCRGPPQGLLFAFSSVHGFGIAERCFRKKRQGEAKPAGVEIEEILKYGRGVFRR